ncbi:hypothetical protein TNCV_4812621 [Trichonephila clavipes]|nr:hypothetical protein TNCV_4812621 [Trichonephila clavipes]
MLIVRQRIRTSAEVMGNLRRYPTTENSAFKTCEKPVVFVDYVVTPERIWIKRVFNHIINYQPTVMEKDVANLIEKHLLVCPAPIRHTAPAFQATKNRLRVDTYQLQPADNLVLMRNRGFS